MEKTAVVLDMVPHRRTNYLNPLSGFIDMGQLQVQTCQTHSTEKFSIFHSSFFILIFSV